MKLLLFISILLTSISLSAQYTVQGNVYNDVGEAVSFASITIYEGPEGKTITFTNTDSEGNYSLKLQSPGTYWVKIRNIKYETYEEELVINSDKKEYRLDIGLFGKESQLSTVIAKGREKLADISGDTITFKIEKFTDKTERNLGDIINKLPGMEVDEGGNIKANGEKVDALLVEGKEFYSESHKMATENLNADAVKDIQLLTDYKEDGKMDDMNAEKQTAVNVQLKDDYKNKITGDVLIGSGYESKYDAHANLFKFNTQGNISFIADIQNTGESVFTFEDYMAFLGGFSEMVSQGSRGQQFTIRFSGNSIWSLINPGNNVEKRNNQVGALNINQNLSDKWKLKVTSIFSGTQQESYSEQFRNYYDGTLENIFNAQNTQNFFNSTNWRLKFQPNDSVLVTYKGSFNYSNNEDRNSIDNILNQNPQFFKDDNDSSPWGTGHRLNYEFKPSKKTLMEIGASYEYKFDPNRNEVNSDQQYLTLPDSPNNQYHTIYDLDKTTQNSLVFANLKISNKKLVYMLELGAKWSDYQLGSDWKDAETNAKIQADNFFYEYQMKRNELYTEVSLSKNKDFWQFEVGAVTKWYALKDKVQSDFDRFMIFPYADISAHFSTSNVLSFGYDYSEGNPQVENYVPNGSYIINSYRNMTVANEDIFNSTYFPKHNLELRYRFFDEFSGWHLYSSVRYSDTDGSITSESILNGNFNTVNKLIIPFHTQNTSTYIYAGKKFKLGIPMRANIRGNASWNAGYVFINDFYTSEGRNLGFNMGLSTNMEPAFNVEIGFSYNENKTEIDNEFAPTQFFKSNTPFIEFRGAYEKSGIKWNTRFERRSQQNIDLNLWDLDFTYSRPGSDWEFGAVGRNLLNFSNKEQVNVNSTHQYLYENRYRILPGFAMLTAKLKF